MSKRRPRCRSWRFIGSDIPASRHLPVGRDHAVWRPCSEPVDHGQLRCVTCSRALLSCPNSLIRLELAREPEVEMWVLAALATDGDAVVSDVAKGRWEARGGASATELPRSPATAAVSAASAASDDPWA